MHAAVGSPAIERESSGVGNKPTNCSGRCFFFHVPTALTFSFSFFFVVVCLWRGTAVQWFIDVEREAAKYREGVIAAL